MRDSRSKRMRKYVIGVMGGGEDASEEAVRWGYELGQHIAQRDWILLTGGRQAGVMDSASLGAHNAGGFVIGVLMGADASGSSDGLDVAICTGMGSARNNVNVLSSDVVIACGETSAGTLSEIALAVKAKKPVVLLNNDDATREFLQSIGKSFVSFASSPEEAIALAENLLKG